MLNSITNNVYIKEVLIRISKKPLLLPAICSITASFACFYGSKLIAVPLVLVIVLIGLLVVSFMNKEMEISVKVVLLSTLVFVIYCYLHVQLVMLREERINLVTDSRQNITATVVSNHYYLDGSVRTSLYSNEFGLFYLYNNEDVSELGQTYQFTATIKPVNKPSNPGQFNYAEYLRQSGVFFQLDCLSDYVVIERSNACEKYISKISKQLFAWRLSILDTILLSTDEANAVLLASICLGDKSLVEDNVIQSFSKSNTSHILAVSGTHFSAYLCIISCILSTVFSNKKAFRIICLGFCILVGFLTGWTESVSRAMIMCTCSLFMRDSISGMSLSAIIMELTNPMSCLKIGFQMTYLACGSIKLYSYKLEEYSYKSQSVKKLANAFGVMLLAQIGLMPFWISTNFRIGVTQVLGCVIASVLSGVVCSLFVPSLLLMPLRVVLGEFLFAPSSMFSRLLYIVVDFASKQDAINACGFEPFFVFSLFAFCIIVLLPSCYLRHFLVKPVSVLLCLGIGFQVLSLFLVPKALIVFVDVGQGDCCLLLSGNESALIDTGTIDATKDSLIPVLDYYGVEKIDYCFVSHWDIDHSGGVSTLIEEGYTDYVYTNQYDEALEEVEDESIKLMTAGDSKVVGDDISVLAIGDNNDFENSNDNSLVLSVTCFDTSILFTGDISSEVELSLVNNESLMDYDILKVAHHGSRFSTCQSFLDATLPEFAVISVGENNNYGHPTPEVINRLSDNQIDTLCTSQTGAIIVTITKDDYEIRSFREETVRWPAQQIF